MVCLLFQQTIFSQRGHFGIRAGVTFSHPRINFIDDANDAEIAFRKGIFLGVLFDAYINDRFSFRPGISYVGKGAKQGNPNSTTGYIVDHSSYYFDISLDVIYKVKLKQGKILLGGGPVMGIRSSGDYGFYLSTSDTDFGINLLTAYELPIGLSFNLNYTHGLSNISADKTLVRSFKNRYAGLTVCYVF